MNARDLALGTLGTEANTIIACGVGKWLPSHIAMRFRELQRRNHDDPLDDLFSNGLLVTTENADEYMEIIGMVEMMDICRTSPIDRRSMARLFTATGRALYTSRQSTKCVIDHGHSVGILSKQVIAAMPHIYINDQMADYGTPRTLSLAVSPV